MCGSCAAAAAARQKIQAAKQRVTLNAPALNATTSPCPYTNAMLLIWRDKLKWFKRTGGHIRQNMVTSTINKYIGTVITAINSRDKCAKQTTLEAIAKLITVINGIDNGKL